ncbi:MAG: hypothetical protein A3C82_02840 [Candidatus Wildermuthbacteria bacterium RIFCSPHIGHO2_02_FULL_47_12]|uniref:Response regulatory domain-containing protein n=2 Tax=Parcubacteria group TaxID=1794811 RepID=A0A1G2R551_9BACT|nr:MAG: hypothetical protein A3A24_01395 [Candidatus Buchananbacteria bacterium RIFCSPLOWO2_01_FULL_46_12]OHA67943.1 MAG: hypothetical protein A3C82_02840 [Candidatus Wildermuthbacteria bacterium RIFCSPHIGHO2_02_FULL_47_12]
MVRVLIVDDSLALLGAFAMAYEKMGCQVTTCQTVAEALKAIATGDFQVVHLDDNLTETPPGGSRPHEGSRILAPMALQQGCKVIGCSGEEVDEDGKPLWPVEVAAVVIKPVSLVRLIDLVGPVVKGLGS